MKRALGVICVAGLAAVPVAVACWTPPVDDCIPKKQRECTTTTTTMTTTTTPTVPVTTVVTTPPPPPVTTTAPETPPTAPEPDSTTTSAVNPTPAVLPPPRRVYTCLTLPKGAGAKWRVRLGCKAVRRNPVRVCPPAKPFKAVVRGKRVCLASRPNPTPVAVAGERR